MDNPGGTDIIKLVLKNRTTSGCVQGGAALIDEIETRNVCMLPAISGSENGKGHELRNLENFKS